MHPIHILKVATADRAGVGEQFRFEEKCRSSIEAGGGSRGHGSSAAKKHGRHQASERPRQIENPNSAERSARAAKLKYLPETNQREQPSNGKCGGEISTRNLAGHGNRGVQKQPDRG